MKRASALAAVCAALVLGLAATGVLALDVPEYGTHGTKVPPSCPTRNNVKKSCQVLARVTGIQVRQRTPKGSLKYPYKIHQDGRIVAFSVTLAKPKISERKFFDESFGSPPRAAVAVLKQDTHGRGKRVDYRLLDKSQAFNLRPYFGSKPQFSLHRSLPVKRGAIIGLIVPTWAPILAIAKATDKNHGVSGIDAWRAARDSKKCSRTGASGIHASVGSVRRYGCLYTEARMLYTISVMRDPAVKNRRSH
jgi:hypothetical protein